MSGFHMSIILFISSSGGVLCCRLESFRQNVNLYACNSLPSQRGKVWEEIHSVSVYHDCATATSILVLGSFVIICRYVLEFTPFELEGKFIRSISNTNFGSWKKVCEIGVHVCVVAHSVSLSSMK